MNEKFKEKMKKTKQKKAKLAWRQTLFWPGVPGGDMPLNINVANTQNPNAMRNAHPVNNAWLRHCRVHVDLRPTAEMRSARTLLCPVLNNRASTLRPSSYYKFSW